MKYKSYVIVLIGFETHLRPWVRYEIAKGWNDGKGVLGIYIHNLRDPRTASAPPLYGRCAQGPNPFEQIGLQNGSKLAQYVPCWNPNPADAYSDIAQNLLGWVARAARRS